MTSEWKRLSAAERDFWLKLARPLRLVGWVLLGLAALLLAVIVLIAVNGRQLPSLGTCIFPAIVAGLGAFCFVIARRIHDRRVPQLATVFFWVFAGAGALCLAGGLIGGITVHIDMFWLLPFGLAFIAAGFVARKLFVLPEGTKVVNIQSVNAPTRDYWERPATVSQSQTLVVDENASAAQVDAKIEAHRRASLQRQWQARPDWAAGRIEQESLHHAGRRRLAAMLYAGIAIVLIAIALWQRDVTWLFAAVIGAIVAGVLVMKQIRATRRQRRFAPSHLVLASTPVFVGETLRATVQTGVSRQMQVGGCFALTLECVHRWQEAVDSAHDDGVDQDRTEHHRDVLWSGSAQAAAAADGDSPDYLSVPVTFDLPADQPATTLGGAGESVAWELTIEATLDDIDYSAEFKLPVFARADEAMPAVASAT